MMNNKKGYIAVLTLLVLSLSMVLVTQLFDKGTAYIKLSKTLREKLLAREIAVSGIQLAISKLATVIEKKDNKKEQKVDPKKKQPSKDDEYSKALLKSLLPVINRWQTVTLTEKKDGLDATIKICISCEEGKININKIYDFSKKKFIGESQEKGNYKKFMKKIFARLNRLLKAKDKDLFGIFEKSLKQMHTKLSDPTELLSSKDFEVFNKRVFYEPPIKENKKEKRSIYLTDIFTVWTDSSTLEPWLLSDSMLGLFDLKRAGGDEIKKRKESVSKWLKKFSVKSNWAGTDWNTMLSPLYGKDVTQLPEGAKDLLSSTFEPKTFSVLCHAQIGNVVQKVYAILKRDKKEKDKKVWFEVSLIKLYWL